VAVKAKTADQVNLHLAKARLLVILLRELPPLRAANGGVVLQGLFRTILTAAIIAGLGCAFALVTNAARGGGIALIRKPVVASDTEGTILTLARAKQLFDAVFVDSRTTQEFEEGHIKDARLLYYEHAEQDWEKVMAGVPFEQQVITYCSGEGCNSSFLVADQLLNVGYEKVSVFHGGWPEWSAAGYPVNGKRRAIKLYEIE